MKVIGSIPGILFNTFDTLSLVRKPFSRSNGFEGNNEENFDIKNHFENKNLPIPVHSEEVVPKSCVDNKFKGSSKIKNTVHVDYNKKNLDNVHLSK